MSENDPYKSSSFIGHSLWLVSDGAAQEAYQQLIDETAQQWGTMSFVPHISLIAGILAPVEDVVQRTKELASQLEEYSCEVKSVGFRDAFFQCVYATMQSTPKVLAANSLARQVFPESQADPPYMPHLSLIYADQFSAQQKQEKIIPSLQQKLGETNKSISSTIPIRAIEVWSTQGNVQDWYMVERIPLKKPESQEQ